MKTWFKYDVYNLLYISPFHAKRDAEITGSKSFNFSNHGLKFSIEEQYVNYN